MCLYDYRRLAQALETPPKFTDILPLIIRQDEVQLLLRLSEGEHSTVELSRLPGSPQNIVESQVSSLFARGFLKKKKSVGTRYSTEPFQNMSIGTSPREEPSPTQREKCCQFPKPFRNLSQSFYPAKPQSVSCRTPSRSQFETANAA